MTARKRVYTWGEGKPYSGDPQSVGEELARIEKAYGDVNPEMVVKEATLEDSPLHGYFEWDDTIAAEEHRKNQARGLIRAVCYVEADLDSEPMRALISVRDGVSSYMDTRRAMGDSETRKLLLGRAKAELAAFRRKYAQLRELALVFEAIEKVTKR